MVQSILREEFRDETLHEVLVAANLLRKIWLKLIHGRELARLKFLSKKFSFNKTAN